MTINKADISNTSTFGTWKTRTNELLAFARKTVSLGASGENNDGDLVLNGNLSLGSVNPTTDTLTVNNISKCASGDFKITNAAEIEGTLTLDTGSGQSSRIQIANGGSNTWNIHTASNHSYLEIGDGNSFIRFDGTQIDGENIFINTDIMPDEISTVNFVGTGTGSTKSVFAEAEINAGNIIATKISSVGTISAGTSSDFAEVIINGGTINNTVIGGTTAVAGTFSSIATTSNGNVTLNGTGQLRGDVAKADGTTVVDVSEAQFKGTADLLAEGGITEVLKAVYPIGSLYTSTANVNPGDDRAADGTGGLGFGTWERYAEGRTLVGVDTEGSIGVVAGHTSEKSAANDFAGRGRSGVVYLTTFNHGLDVGDLIDINVGDNVTMDAYSSPNNPVSDAFNPWAYTDANARGLEIIELGGSSGTAGTGVGSGVPYVRFSIESLYANMTSQQQADYDAIVSFKNFQVGGSDLTASNGMTIRNSRFRAGGSKGGTSHCRLDVEHIPDHVHDMKSPLTDIQYYGINDDNEDPSTRLKANQSFGPTHNSLQYTDQQRNTEFLGQFGNIDGDGQFNRNSGLVRNYNGNQIVDIDVDKGHENMPPYEVVYIYRRTA